MKKILAIALTAALLLTMTACLPGGVQEPEKPLTTELTDDALHLLWEKLSGCWVSGENIVYFTWTEGPAFLSGTWDVTIPRGRDAALVTRGEDLGGEVYRITLTYPPVSGDAADEQDLRPLEHTVTLDLSGLEAGTLLAQAPEDEQRSYTFAAVSYSDAWDAHFAREYASFEEMQSFWTELTGRWVSEDGRFVEFDQADSHTLLFMTGMLNAGAGRGWGTYEKTLSAMGEIPMTIIISYPPFESELEGSLPADTLTFELDMMEIHTHGKLPICFEGEEWITFHREG